MTADKNQPQDEKEPTFGSNVGKRETVPTESIVLGREVETTGHYTIVPHGPDIERSK